MQTKLIDLFQALREQETPVAISDVINTAIKLTGNKRIQLMEGASIEFFGSVRYEVTPRHLENTGVFTSGGFYGVRYSASLSRDSYSVTEIRSNDPVSYQDIIHIVIWFTDGSWITTIKGAPGNPPIFVYCIQPLKPNRFTKDPAICGVCGEVHVVEIPMDGGHIDPAFYCPSCSNVSVNLNNVDVLPKYLSKYFNTGGFDCE